MKEFEAIYDKDPYIRSFEATVLSCEKTKKGYEVELSDTAFYPEGGGQPYDQGTINGIFVEEVHKKGDRILHLLKEPVETGIVVNGQIDWQRRFDFMQQHSGEHIVSGIIHGMFGYENVGFHMGKVIQIDFNGPLSWQDVEVIERKANQAITDNIPIEYLYPDAEELEQMPYRSKKELTGKVRVVRIQNIDLCACCGTHVAYTGEIGMIKILSCIKHKEGVRLEMVAGEKAFLYMQEIFNQNHAISVALSAKMNETSEAVKGLQKALMEKERMISILNEKYMNYKLDMFMESQRVIMSFEEEMDRNAMRKFANALVHEKYAHVGAVFSSHEDEYQYVLVSDSFDLRKIVKPLNERLNGRGGGNSEMIQGSFHSTQEEIEEAMHDVEKMV